MSRPTAKTFQARLEHGGDRLNWTIVRIPFDVARQWGSRGSLKVKGEINGFSFRTSLFPTGEGAHTLLVNKAMQKGGKVRNGMTARFRVEPDAAPREIDLPLELKRVFRQSKRLEKYYGSLNYSIRQWIASMVSEGKHSDTRLRRAEQVGEWLMETLEAERELPPVLKIALSRNPKAQAGWESMTGKQRRGQLLAILQYRNPSSRERRASKAIELMMQRGEKPGRKCSLSDELDR